MLLYSKSFHPGFNERTLDGRVACYWDFEDKIIKYGGG